jgi:hypothetical protein
LLEEILDIHEKESIPMAKIGKKDWEVLVSKSDISVRTINVLLDNFISSDELMACDSIELLNLKNCGVKTFLEIINFIEYLKELETVNSTKKDEPHNLDTEQETYRFSSLKNKLSQPPNKNTIHLLPVFNPTHDEDIVVQDLHPDFKVYVLLSDIAFSARTTKMFEQLGLKTFGELMCIKAEKLFAEKNFGRKSHEELRQTIIELVLGNLLEDFPSDEGRQPLNPASHHLPESSDGNIIEGRKSPRFRAFFSYEAMVDYFVKKAIESERNQKILFDIFCFHGSRPLTLQKLGEKYQITRERVRQIIIKNIRILKIKRNLNRLSFFWDSAESIVLKGGGLIHLYELASTLTKEFNWSGQPNPLAIGQLLSIRIPKSRFKTINDIVKIKSVCLSCKRPQQLLGNLEFETNNFFHIEILVQKLLENCEQHCDIKPIPLSTFHKAFIEKIISSAQTPFVIKDELLYKYEHWAVKNGDNLEDAIYYVLKNNKLPMHYSEIAREIRSLSTAFADITDRNLHASIGRYKKMKLVHRGIFGLNEWEIKQYRTVSDAIEQLLEHYEFPMKRKRIISELENEFAIGNISTALTKRSMRFIAVGEGFHDLRRRWEQRTVNNLILYLPEELQIFVNYIITENKYSYTSVLAMKLIKSMKDDRTIDISKLKERFYNFYASRRAKGLIVEKNKLMLRQFNTMEPLEFKNKVLMESIEKFINTGYISKKGAVIELRTDIADLITEQYRELIIIVLLKSLHQYYNINYP